MITDSGGIYKIVCSTNEYFYIGSSINIQRRWWQHISTLRKNKHINPVVQSTYNKYGESTFSIEVLELVDDINSLTDIETSYLIKNISIKECMNISCDATAPMRGRLSSNETKNLISKNHADIRQK